MSRGVYNPKLHICPDCGGEKSPNATRCRKCDTELRREKKVEARTCPQCGGKKSWAATLCMSCTSNDKKVYETPGWDRSDSVESHNSVFTDKLTDEWCYQFVGLFLGEGTANLRETNAGSVACLLSLQLRADDYETILDIHDKLGGNVRLNNRSGSNPTYVWSVGRIHHVKEIIDIINSFTVIPAKKSTDVEIVNRFIKWRLEQPFHGADWDYAIQFVKELREAREYEPPQIDG